jgi:hypothetical protein
MKEYRKAFSVYLKKDKWRVFPMILRNGKANLKYGISQMSYSYYQLDSVSESLWGEYIIDY